MNISELLKINIDKLKGANIEDSRTKAQLLLCSILNVDKNFLITNYSKELEFDVINKFNRNIIELLNGKPLQYITKKQEFMKLNFYVDGNVLIPRSDTEVLVQNVLDVAKDNMKILDLCTGSGIIAISIAKYTNAMVSASDISEKALEVAIKNAKNNNVDVNFIKSDCFQSIREKYDIIVSNPPYIERKIIRKLDMEVQNEPIIALDGGEDGLHFYKVIAKEAKKYLKNEGTLALEIGYNQRVSVQSLLQENEYNNIRCYKDLAGLDRNFFCNVRKDL